MQITHSVINDIQKQMERNGTALRKNKRETLLLWGAVVQTNHLPRAGAIIPGRMRMSPIIEENKVGSGAQTYFHQALINQALERSDCNQKTYIYI